MKKVIFEKTYHGFEDAVDLDRDVSELWDEPAAKGIPGEFQGRLKVVITYEDDDELDV